MGQMIPAFESRGLSANADFGPLVEKKETIP